LKGEDTKPCVDDPVVLILSYFSHTRNLGVIEQGRHHGIIIYLPPHFAYKLQLFDASFVGPFKHYYSMEIEKWMIKHTCCSVIAY
jgi:hypothetical protein